MSASGHKRPTGGVLATVRSATQSRRLDGPAFRSTTLDYAALRGTTRRMLDPSCSPSASAPSESVLRLASGGVRSATTAVFSSLGSGLGCRPEGAEHSLLSRFSPNLWTP